MKVHKVTKEIKVKRASLDEILRDNRPYFEALAKEYGDTYAAEAERHFLQDLGRDLESLPEEEEMQVPVTQIDDESGNETT